MAEDFTDKLIANLGTLAPYLNLETLWKMRGLNTALRAALSNGELWWAQVKLEADDPPLNPYNPAVDWATVAFAMSLESRKLDRAMQMRSVHDLTTAATKLREIHKVDLALTLFQRALDKTQGPPDAKPTREFADALYNLSLIKVGSLARSLSAGQR
jgi:hypothetical protein